MTTLETALRTYQELADRYDRQKESKQRDLFLILAADAALAAGKGEESERLRNRLLQGSPHNLIRPYSSFAEALQSPDIQLYIADLKRQFPPQLAERLLEAQREKDPGLGLLFADWPSSNSVEPDLKVYPFQETQDKAKPTSSATAPTRPTVKISPPAPPLSTRSATALPKPIPLTSTKPSARSPYESSSSRTTAKESDEEGNGSSWIASLLYVLLLVLGLGLAGYTFVRPFLPRQ